MPDRSAVSDAQLLEYRALLLRRLEHQAAEFSALAAALPEAEWHVRRAADGTALYPLLLHVRDAEGMAYWPRLQRILTEDGPHLDPFPHHRWSLEQPRPEETLAEVLTSFLQTRAEVLARLQRLDPAGWSRLGFHPPSGPRTTQWWVERLYTHARNHLVNLQAAAAPRTARPDPYAQELG